MNYNTMISQLRITISNHLDHHLKKVRTLSKQYKLSESQQNTLQCNAARELVKCNALKLEDLIYPISDTRDSNYETLTIDEIKRLKVMWSSFNQGGITINIRECIVTIQIAHCFYSNVIDLTSDTASIPRARERVIAKLVFENSSLKNNEQVTSLIEENLITYEDLVYPLYGEENANYATLTEEDIKNLNDIRRFFKQRKIYIDISECIFKVQLNDSLHAGVIPLDAICNNSLSIKTIHSIHKQIIAKLAFKNSSLRNTSLIEKNLITYEDLVYPLYGEENTDYKTLTEEDIKNLNDIWNFFSQRKIDIDLRQCIFKVQLNGSLHAGVIPLDAICNNSLSVKMIQDAHKKSIAKLVFKNSSLKNNKQATSLIEKKLIAYEDLVYPLYDKENANLETLTKEDIKNLNDIWNFFSQRKIDIDLRQCIFKVQLNDSLHAGVIPLNAISNTPSVQGIHAAYKRAIAKLVFENSPLKCNEHAIHLIEKNLIAYEDLVYPLEKGKPIYRIFGIQQIQELYDISIYIGLNNNKKGLSLKLKDLIVCIKTQTGGEHPLIMEKKDIDRILNTPKELTNIRNQYKLKTLQPYSLFKPDCSHPPPYYKTRIERQNHNNEKRSLNESNRSRRC